MSNPQNQTTRTPEPSGKQINAPESGIYVGRVTNHLDNEFMGSLEVELFKQNSSGNSPDASGQTVTCSYASPFYGVTPFNATGSNPGYDYTQKSYGFWAVPPDIGTKVLVIVTEGGDGEAFWVGCIQDKYMNFMVPGNASTTYNEEDSSRPRPTGEYNKNTETGNGNDPTQYVKPCSYDACAQLDRSGLADDPIRGTTSSSARREVPSMVFGWSTPGPSDRRSGKPRFRTGERFQQAELPGSRLGGSSFVMDDGDPSMYRVGAPAETPSKYATIANGGDPARPMNELVRIKTRTGHQILLHNSEDLIYIAHGSGDSWIEMTSSGKIDIYSKDSISLRTENDINFKADRNINFEAGKDINMISGQNTKTQTGANWEVKVGADGKLTCDGSSNIKSSSHRETADKILMNSSPAASPASAANPPLRTPGHEPYDGHENLNPTELVPEKTENSPESGNEKKEESKAETPQDTFKKCPPMEKSDVEAEEEERRSQQTNNETSGPNTTITQGP